ncbi:M23 family metallopeptidase [Cohnella faecalis]|uniref:M23 family metallopeptidase n=1 Tax=Cohnella faecalis TaxID=2315694 RepID=UPI003616063E
MNLARQPGLLIRTILTASAVALAAVASSPAPSSHAAAPKPPDAFAERMKLYARISSATRMDWRTLAAIDQYERTMARAHPRTRPIRKDAISGIFIPKERWSGELNPDSDDSKPGSIRFFHGIGRDGSGDGIADRDNDADLLFSVASQIAKYGNGKDDFAIGLWEYYQNTRSVQRVEQFRKIYQTYGKLELTQHAFPLPVSSVYSYRSTWGNRRSWGGYRIHEGTDIFAGYGVPVRSTCFGIVEVKGWNPFGGWRIGIRDLDNLYHYYAHLSGYEKSIKPGDVVRPGQVIGWVGSSGYGRPGTQGKFPPHLHYGVYRDRGLVEWAFDPYPMLHRWESAEKKALKVDRQK